MTTFLERFNRFAHAFTEFLRGGGDFVDQNTANIRAEICAQCHNNVPDDEARVYSGGCTTCNKAFSGIENVFIDGIRKSVIGNKITTSHNKLKSCKLCGCDNKISVWFPLKVFNVSEETNNAFPFFCYKRTDVKI
jgi:hypothetical protein